MIPFWAGAQAPGMPGGNAGFNAAVAKLFGNIPVFSAMVETALTNKADKSRLALPMRMLKREDRFRIEVDFGKMKGTGVALQGLSAMQNIGMARMTSLVLPQDKGMIILFPELKFQTRVSLSEADLPTAGFQLTKKPLGKETIQGQPCVRNLVTLTAADGTKTEVTTWESQSLGGFPVRMLFRQEDGTMLMTFSEVSLGAPAEELFKVPGDYRAFSSMAGLMQEAMTRAISGPAGR